MENDSAVMFKQHTPLEFSSSGHDCTDIKDQDNTRKQLKDDMILAATAEDEALTVTENHQVNSAKSFSSFTNSLAMPQQTDCRG